MISERTRAALAAAKARGVKLGNPNGLSDAARDKGREAGARVRQTEADEFATRTLPLLQPLHEEGCSLGEIARKLREQSVLTPSGKNTAWTGTTVRNLLRRGQGA